MTQKQKVLTHLQLGLSITPMEAFAAYRITRLAAIIHDLRNEGYRITDVSEKKYARYVLEAA